MAENGSMKIVRRSTGVEGMIFIQPETHVVLFRHCAGGREAVHPFEFDEIVKPLLLIHGVKEIRIEDK